MTNSPGDGQTPQDPSKGQPDENPPGQEPRGYWEQQAAPGPPAQGPPAQGPPPQGSYAQGQPPYGQVPGYPPQPPMQYAPDHPRATTVLVLGIVSLVLCQVVGPFAWAMGRSTLAEIDASNGRLGGRGAANAGFVLGIISTVLLGLGLLLFVGVLGLAVLGAATSNSL